MVQPKYSPEEALDRVKLMMKYDLSKTYVENKKVVSEQTQSNTPDPLSCIKNYFQTKTYFYFKGAKFNRNSITGISEMEVTLNSKLIWKFFSANNGNRTWKQFSEGTLTDEGLWSCNGDSNFTMKSSSGKLNFDSKNAEEFFKQIQSGGQPTQSQPVTQPTQSQPVTQPTQSQPVTQPTQSQPVTQPTQTGPAAGYTDPNKQSELTRKDSLLSDLLKNQSISKSVCRQQIKQFDDMYRGKAVADESTILKTKNIVQRCKYQHYGKFDVLGVGGDDIDKLLDKLSGSAAGGPPTSPRDPKSIFRIK
jgi:hypothetical protein